MLQMTRSTLAAILAHAAEAEAAASPGGAAVSLPAVGLLVGRGGLGRRDALQAERAKSLPADRARGRFDLHPGDWQRIDRAARTRGLDVIGSYLCDPKALLSTLAGDTATAHEGYSYLVVRPERSGAGKGGGAPALFAFEQVDGALEAEPVTLVPDPEPTTATPRPKMGPLPPTPPGGSHGMS